MQRFVCGLAVIGGIAIAVPARADVIHAIDSGWYNQAGSHTAQNDNYIVGDVAGTERHNFVVFDLTSVTDDIIAASIQLYNPDNALPALRGYVSPDASETLALYDVTTDIDTLRLSQVGAPGIAIFGDLGSGTLLGNQAVSAADNGTTISIALNADGLAALNAARGGFFAVGGALITLGSFGDEYVFGFSQAIDNPEVRRLSFRTVPEPTAAALLGVGLAFALRRRTIR
jgi:hypothetical protein